MKYITLFLIAITIVHIRAFSQTGIGGVGDNTGTSSLSGWFDANQSVTTTGSAVTQWGDASGYTNNATPPAVANQPTLTAAAVN